MKAERKNNVFNFEINDKKYWISVIKKNIIRVTVTLKEDKLNNFSYIIKDNIENIKHNYSVLEKNNCYVIETERLRLEVDILTEEIKWWDKKENRFFTGINKNDLTKKDVIKYKKSSKNKKAKRIKTVDGERSVSDNLIAYVARKGYEGQISFNWYEDESIHGLGQFEEGIYNYRNENQYMYQHNMRIPIPFFVSDRNYGVLFNCMSIMKLENKQSKAEFVLDTVSQNDYYFIAGNKLDDIISGYRFLTGRAEMLPKWAFGYIQSKEAYKTQKELLDVVKEYRHRNIPIDCIVQDWNSWEEGKWGEKILDKSRYPNMEKINKKIHSYNVHTMISIWPNMSPKSENYKELYEKGYILNDDSTYDAFDENARQIYWKQANEGLFQKGFDSWWCDSTEPFSSPDWKGEDKLPAEKRYEIVGSEHKKYLDPEYSNCFALLHAKGIYENQLKTTENKRVVNLTRSGYPSIQKYGAILWSGDTSATWGNFEIQITEGLNFAMSGMPFWTLDIGAFFTVKDAYKNRGCGSSGNTEKLWFWQGDYNEGVNDLGYRELYVRWLQYGVFLPVFRSHGTDTPREIWHFGNKGDMFYDAIEKYIKLRYRLIPYIYSMAARANIEDYTMLRSLMFDFAKDEKVKEIHDQFMFGESILVCPITEPYYYENDSKPINKKKKRKCYLPKGCNWFNYWTGERYKGGKCVIADAPIDIIPLFIKEGSIIPTEKELKYADDKTKNPLELTIYPGENADFSLYDDQGDNYDYKKGKYSIIKIKWDDKNKKITINSPIGEYSSKYLNKEIYIHVDKISKNIKYTGNKIEISFN